MRVPGPIWKGRESLSVRGYGRSESFKIGYAYIGKSSPDHWKFKEWRFKKESGKGKLTILVGQKDIEKMNQY
jgi:hypothetical protein